jgi:cyclophilin family peptidyl-prolyl cis-trans isomerase
MTTTVKRAVLGLIIVALPIAWLWIVREKPPQPPPPPPSTEKPPKPAANRVAIPGRQVVIETTRGKIIASLYERDAKITTNNFMSLVNRKFYNGLIFHRVEPGLVIQTGDPTGTGSGGSGKSIPLEVTPLLDYNTEGMLGMARTPDPNSASSQFFINLQPYPDWNNSYAIFGKVVAGMDVANKIKVGDKIKKMYLLPPDRPAVPVRVGT